MGSFELEKELFGLFDYLRGQSIEPSLFPKILRDRNIKIPIQNIPDFIRLLTTFSGKSFSYLTIPDLVISFIETLAKNYKPKVILDPWAGAGVLLSTIQNATSAEKYIAFSNNIAEYDLGTYLLPDTDWITGDYLQLISEIDAPIDMVACVLPFGYRAKNEINITNGKKIKISGEVGDQIIASSISKLKDDGIGLFVVTPSFFFRENSVLRHIPDLGFGIDAAFSIPAGTFAHTTIPTYMIVVKKHPIEKTFVAQLTNSQKPTIKSF